MSTIVFGRIFWKEYRAHRALWLSCVGASLFIQVLVATRLFGHLSEFVVGCAIFFPMMYALGCGAILFAGEREERTSDWLLALATPVGATVAAKFAFAILSTLAMQLSLYLAAVALEGQAFSGFHRMMPVQHMIALALLIWSVFGSLVSRRVLISIIAGLFWGVAMNVWPQLLFLYYTDSLRRTMHSDATAESLHILLMIAIIILTILLDLWLACRWCQGKYLDGSIVDGLNSYFATRWVGTKTKVRGIHSVWVRPTAKVSVFANEYDQSWRRTWQRLLWQERRRESMHLLLLCVGIGLAVLTPLLSWGSRDWLTMFTLICVFPAPLIMGVLGFRADSARQQPRFLSNRGISPGSLWLAKQVVWLWRAIWIPSTILAVSYLMEYGIVQAYLPRQSAPIYQLLREFFLRPDQVCWSLLLGYAAGQLAAILFDRIVLSMGFGILLNLAGAIWISLVEGLDIPQWWSLGLPVAVMLLITFWQMRYWLLEDHSFGRRCRLTLGLMLPVVCLFVAVPCYRVGAAADWVAYDPTSSILWYNELAQQRVPLTDANTMAIRRLRLLAEQATSSDEELDEVIKTLQGPITTLTVPQHGAYASELIGELHSASRRDVRSDYVSLHERLRARASQLKRDGHTDRSFRDLLGSLKLARYSAVHGSLVAWLVANQQQRRTLDQIVELAAASSAVDEFRQQVQQELQQFPSLSDSAVAEYLTALEQWVQSPDPDLQATVQQYDQGVARYSPAALTMMATPWERQRLSFVLLHQSQVEFFHTLALEHQQSLSWSEIPKPLSDSPRLEKLTRTTPPARSLTNLDHIPRLVFDRRVFVRASLIRLTIISFRQQQGRSPTDLLELAEQRDSNSLIDPYTGQLFQYLPAFLMSAGPERLSLQPNAQGMVRIGFAEQGAAGVFTDKDVVWIAASRLLNSDSDQVKAVQAELKHPESIFPIPALEPKTP